MFTFLPDGLDEIGIRFSDAHSSPVHCGDCYWWTRSNVRMWSLWLVAWPPNNTPDSLFRSEEGPFWAGYLHSRRSSSLDCTGHCNCSLIHHPVKYTRAETPMACRFSQPLHLHCGDDWPHMPLALSGTAWQCQPRAEFKYGTPDSFFLSQNHIVISVTATMTS